MSASFGDSHDVESPGVFAVWLLWFKMWSKWGVMEKRPAKNRGT